MYVVSSFLKGCQWSPPPRLTVLCKPLRCGRLVTGVTGAQTAMRRTRRAARGEATCQGTRGGLWPGASKDLRPSAQPSVRHRILPAVLCVSWKRALPCGALTGLQPRLTPCSLRESPSWRTQTRRNWEAKYLLLSVVKCGGNACCTDSSENVCKSSDPPPAWRSVGSFKASRVPFPHPTLPPFSCRRSPLPRIFVLTLL